MAKRFTVGDVEEQARLILLDTEEDAYRFEPKEVYLALAQAVRNIRVARPASRYVGGVLAAGVEFEHEVPQVTGEAVVRAFRALEVEMERRWMEAAVYYVVHKMYLKDDPDTTNANLAAKYLELYNVALGG